METFDIPLVTYYAIVVVSIYGFGLFAWWWRKMGKASEVYKYVMLLFLASAFEFGTAIYARAGFLSEDLNYDIFMKSPLWQLRALPVLIILLLLVIRMTMRIRMSVVGELQNDYENRVDRAIE